MKFIARLTIMLTLFCLLTACNGQRTVSINLAEPDYWPTNGWKIATPESQGMDSSQLAEMLEKVYADQTNLHSLLVIRNGYIVSEAYFHPYNAQTREHVQSVTKSVIGALVGIAMQEGKIKSVDEKLLDYYSGRVIDNPSLEKESIQLKHLLSMSSGLDCQEFSSGTKMEQTAGWVQFMLDLPMNTPPGQVFGYCNGNAHLLSAILERTSGWEARKYANEKLFKPLGILPVTESDWGADPQGYTIGGYGLHLTATELAKIGFLYLHNGKWDGQQILPDEWVMDSTSPVVQKEDGSSYGYLWTIYPSDGHYAALGLGGQQIHIYPEENLVVIVTAGLEAYTEAPEIETLLRDYVIPSIRSDSPLNENTAGVKRLQQAQDQIANPVQPVPPLPSTAIEISGETYHFTENPLGWQTLELVFTPQSSTAELHLNGSNPVDIGLDNIYRLTNNEMLGEIYLRAKWADENTLIADYPYAFGSNRIGELGQSQFQFDFQEERVEITVRQMIFAGEPLAFEGIRVSP